MTLNFCKNYMHIFMADLYAHFYDTWFELMFFIDQISIPLRHTTIIYID